MIFLINPFGHTVQFVVFKPCFVAFRIDDSDEIAHRIIGGNSIFTIGIDHFVQPAKIIVFKSGDLSLGIRNR